MSSRQVDSLAERSRKAFNVPGLAVAVIKDGKQPIMKTQRQYITKHLVMY